jgi:glucokinase
MTTIGVDLGGTNLRVAAFTGEDPTPAEAHRELVGDDRSPGAIVDRVAAAIEQVAAAVGGVDGGSAGIGLAAMLADRAGTVANSPHLRWRGVPFGALLAARLGPAWSLGVYNDVNAVTWGEHVHGAGRGCADVLAVYVGTGIGGGLVVDGRLVEGATNAAGEIGHVKVAWGDRAEPCACGQRGCVEAYVGGDYVQRRIRAELARRPSSAVVALAGGPEHATPGHVDLAAADGDDYALELWAELAPLLAVALGNACALLNPARLILGGGMLGRTPLLRDMVLSAMTLATPVAHLDALSVVDAELGDDAGLVGAAHLAASGVSLIPR